MTSYIRYMMSSHFHFHTLYHGTQLWSHFSHHYKQKEPLMEPSDTTTTIATPFSSFLTPTPVVLSPCAACKILRRRCADKCVLAPYFPPTDPVKFTTAHRVFGASNIIKLLQELPETQRSDAVSSMVYEANARIRDPVYGCAGAIFQLQKQVAELQRQLAKAQAEVVRMQAQQANLVAIICMEFTSSSSKQLRQAPGTDDQLVAGGGEMGFFQDDGYCCSLGVDDINSQYCSSWESL